MNKKYNLVLTVVSSYHDELFFYYLKSNMSQKVFSLYEDGSLWRIESTNAFYFKINDKNEKIIYDNR